MANIDAKTVMELRKMTGAPMMDCKAALVESNADMEVAVGVLRKKGLQTAEGKAGREAAEGRVFSYVHHNGRIGVLVEVACETDFVARNEEFLQFGKDLSLHVAAMKPRFVSREEVDQSVLDKEREFLTEQANESMKGKPQEIIDKAVEGRLAKFYAESCLLDQLWVKDEGSGSTVEQVRQEKVGRIGENIQIRRFSFVELGG
jgi:elongation factor Ts